jgi:hypothetical protein
MSSSLHHLVPKLTGTNYSTRATKMEMVLIKDSLWPIACEERLRPERPAQEVRQWDSDARKATANIMLCLAEGVEQHVKGTRNPVDLWKKLQKLLLDQSWRRGKRTSTYGAAAKLVMRILTCLFIYLTRTQEVE